MDCFGYLGLGSSIISICISFFHVLVTCDRKTAFERERRPDTVSDHSVLKDEEQADANEWFHGWGSELTGFLSWNGTVVPQLDGGQQIQHRLLSSSTIWSVVLSRANFRFQMSKQACWISGHNVATPSVTTVTR